MALSHGHQPPWRTSGLETPPTTSGSPHTSTELTGPSPAIPVSITHSGEHGLALRRCTKTPTSVLLQHHAAALEVSTPTTATNTLAKRINHANTSHSPAPRNSTGRLNDHSIREHTGQTNHLLPIVPQPAPWIEVCATHPRGREQHLYPSATLSSGSGIQLLHAVSNSSSKHRS